MKDTKIYLIKNFLLQNPPITSFEKIDGQIKLGGYFGKVWQILEQRMQFG
jgi:hypothetical protein